MKYRYDPPGIIKKLFPDFIWHSSIDKILLTFDDGPNPETTEVILKELDNNSVKAAFFCVGNNIQKYPSLAKEILQSGHLIANHTFSHKIITKFPRKVIVKDINSFNDIAEELLRFSPKYFRPPHGKFNLRTSGIMQQVGLKNIMWSMLTYDYKNDINIVKFALKNYLKKNSIVVLHDSIKSKNIITDSIKIILEEANEKGYAIGEPGECLK